MTYEPVIGLEIHLQPKTKSKMFCSCDARYFGAAPNTHTCPVCLALPGALPVPNKKALELCIKLGLAMECNISKESKFDRKNYFYPDLPKGYQISQYDQPVAYKGYLEIDIDGDSRRIEITRVHMEEDTGKSLHEGNLTLLDFNKSGVPLIELVTEPDFKDSKEVLLFAKRLRQIVRYLDISDADMEKGQMRYELNISMKPVDTSKLPDYKVEVKNISSISVLQKVIESEIKRQTDILKSGKTPVQETRGLVDMSGKTHSQRAKGNSDDYRYFPEPDIPPMYFDDELISQIKNSLSELPHQKKARYMKDYGFAPDTAETIIATKLKANWFESGLPQDINKNIVKEYAKLLISDTFGLLKADKLKISNLKFDASELYALAKLIVSGKLPRSAAKRQVLPIMYKFGTKAENIIAEKGLDKQVNENDLEDLVNEVIENNPKIAASVQKNPNAIKALLGQVMAKTKGKADPIKTSNLLKEKFGI